MKNRRTKGFSFVVLFVIFLMIITVLSWKSCARDPIEAAMKNNKSVQSFIDFNPIS